MDVGVTGSVAFDHIMSFGGRFQDHILADKIHALNVSFLVNGFEKRRGGCAPNIAYACALHGLHAGVIGTVGHDFSDYGDWLKERGVDLAAVKVIEDHHTASCFITTDRANNQITGFYPGAMAFAGELSLKDDTVPAPKIAVVAPNDPGAMTRYPGECRELGIPFLYDPGQQVIALDADQLRDGITGARGLICNDYELATIQKTLGGTLDDLLALTEMVIVTLGEKGSRIHTRDADPVEVPVAPVETVVDPTGCGDAYRGGFLAGHLRDLPLEDCGLIGALTAAYCIEVQGTVEYSFDRAAFAARFEQAFGRPLTAPADA